MKEFIKYVFYYEKARYYYGGALMFPVRITQKFWDEMQERKRYYTEQKTNRVDTTYDSETADLGSRPITPDWIVELRGNALFISSIIGWPIILGYILSQIFKQ